MKRILAVLVIALFSIAVCPHFYADDSSYIVQPRYAHLSSVGAGLTSLGGNLYRITGSAMANSAAYEVSITVSLEKLSGGEWSAVPGYSWNATMTASASATAERKILLSGTYQVRTHVQVYLNGVLVEETDAYSNAIKI